MSGVFFPVDNVPPWLQVIAKLNPLTYGVDAIRQLFLDGRMIGLASDASGATSLGVTVGGYKMGILEDTAVIGILGFILISAAVWSFNRQE